MGRNHSFLAPDIRIPCAGRLSITVTRVLFVAEGSESPDAAYSSASAAAAACSPVGLDAAAIASYPKVAFSSRAAEADAMCSICLSEYRDGEMLRVMPERKPRRPPSSTATPGVSSKIQGRSVLFARPSVARQPRPAQLPRTPPPAPSNIHAKPRERVGNTEVLGYQNPLDRPGVAGCYMPMAWQPAAPSVPAIGCQWFSTFLDDNI